MAERVTTTRIKDMARALGFDLVGVTSAQPPDHLHFYHEWLGRGMAGEMAYLGRNLDRRSDPREVLPDAKSILCVGMNYTSPDGGESSPNPSGRIAQYARGDDYHDVMKLRLLTLLEQIQRLLPDTTGRAYVDTGPILERDFAARAGLGWFGKNTNLIHKGSGSQFFLGELLLTADLEPDSPVTDHCGTCTRCIDACPTDALREPYVLDSNLCISYLTIELKGPIPLDLRAKLGNWIYGCDICQDVCPWNEKHARVASEEAFQPRPGFGAPNLHVMMSLDQAAFSRTFRNSPIKRTKRRGLLRNVAVALGNTGSTDDAAVLCQALGDDEPLIRRHAAWALGRIGGDAARSALADARECEMDAEVFSEIETALASVPPFVNGDVSGKL